MQTSNYWLYSEFCSSSSSGYKERYYWLLEEILEKLSHDNYIETIQLDYFIEIWKSFIQSIPLPSLAVFRYLYKVNRSYIKHNKLDSQKNVSVYLEEFKNLILNTISQHELSMQGLKYFMMLNCESVIRIVLNTFWHFDFFQKLIIETAKEKLELIKKEPKFIQLIIPPDEVEVDITVYLKFFINIVPKHNSLINLLFDDFEDLKIPARKALLERLLSLMKHVHIPNDTILKIIKSRESKENKDDLILKLIEFFKGKPNIDPEIFSEINLFILNSKKSEIIFDFLHFYNINDFNIVFPAIQNLDEEKRSLLVNKLLNTKRELAKEFFMKLHIDPSLKSRGSTEYIQKTHKLFFDNPNFTNQENFTMEEFLEMINELVQNKDFSPFLMMTIILVYNKFKKNNESDLFSKLMESVKVLLEKQVWKDKATWKIVKKFFYYDIQLSLQVMATLPEEVQAEFGNE